MNNTNYKTYFVTAKVEVVFEVFCDGKDTAIERLNEALLDKDCREHMFEDAYSMVEIEAVEDADEYFDGIELK